MEDVDSTRIVCIIIDGALSTFEEYAYRLA